MAHDSLPNSFQKQHTEDLQVWLPVRIHPLSGKANPCAQWIKRGRQGTHRSGCTPAAPEKPVFTLVPLTAGSVQAGMGEEGGFAGRQPPRRTHARCRSGRASFSASASSQGDGDGDGGCCSDRPSKAALREDTSRKCLEENSTWKN